MNVGILLLSHGAIGACLKKEAGRIIAAGDDISVLGIAAGDRCADLGARLEQRIAELDRGAGVLVLADLEGATPCNAVLNVVHRLSPGNRTRVVTGLNLPMLLKVLTYRSEPLDKLAELAVSGGAGGIHQETAAEPLR